MLRFKHSSGFLPTEIHADLQKVYGNGALKYATVCKWVRRFNDCQESIENDPWVGRPVSVLTEKNVATVKTLIEEDARYTVQEIEELNDIHSSSVLKILREPLGLRKIWARWVPHLLTDEQKQSRVRLASQVIEKYVRPVIACRCKTNCMLYAIFFDSKDSVLQIPVAKGSSVTGKFYRESVLTELVDFLSETQTAHLCPWHQITPW